LLKSTRDIGSLNAKVNTQLGEGVDKIWVRDELNASSASIFGKELS
jgi:hypothetical protein